MARELRRARKYNFIYKHNRNILNESRKRIPTEHNTNTGIEFAPQIFFYAQKRLRRSFYKWILSHKDPFFFDTETLTEKNIFPKILHCI